jgi:RNA polymerase subunit RPABC4/transcription elongation factor Spt4
MQVKNENQSIFARELKIVPVWAWVLAGICFVCAQIFFNVALAHHPGGPPAWARPLLGLLAGIGGACYLLIIGYINRDAKRRGMSSALWTIVAIVIPNALGILLYFVLRQPLHGDCPQCGHAIQTGFAFCPQCSCRLGMNCVQCQRLIGSDDRFCPYCGCSVRNPQGPPQAAPQTNLPG